MILTVVASACAVPSVEISTVSCGTIERPMAAADSWAIPGAGVDVLSNPPIDEGAGGDCAPGLSTVGGILWECVDFINRLMATS